MKSEFAGHQQNGGADRPGRPARRATPAHVVALFCWCLAAATAVAASWVSAQPAQATWREKVAPSVLRATADQGVAEVLLVLDAQANLQGAPRIQGKERRTRWVFERLSGLAAQSQGDLLAWLRAHDVEHRAFWIHNMIWARTDSATLEQLARRAEVARVAANAESRMPRPLQSASRGACPFGGSEPSLTHVGAETFWNQGVLGQGVVVGGMDTGYDWQHPALRDAYRGWDGASAEHSYSWHDAIHSGGGICGADSTQPCDDHGHGTHTLGIMVGEAGGARFGVAPAARWIGCRTMDQGNGTPATYSECLQWFVAPTDLAGQNPDPAQAPDVINNSWLCNAAEGCTDPEILRAVVENVRAAGIVVVASAGNDGSSCASTEHPPGIYAAALTVGATDLADQIASFSSRGPVTSDGSDRLKPDLVAPGIGICSTWPGGAYVPLSGTSMSGPHVAGLVALLLSAQPCLRGEVDLLESLILGEALPRTTTQTCGAVAGSTVPNNTYGWGAMRAAVPSDQVCFLLFADGFDSGGTAAWTASTP